MSVVRKITCLVAGALMLAFGAHVAAAADGEFSGGQFTCLQYTNGLGANASGKMQSNLARLWMLGYLAGYAKAQGKLEWSDDKADEQKLSDLILTRCREFPQNAILAVSMQSLVNDAKKIPKATGTDFSPGDYTCGQHVDAKAGAAADTVKADLADLWAFAFIQGFKNVGAPDMEISADNKPQLTGVIAKTCGNNRAVPFMDLTALVAEKVKLGG